MSDLVFGLSSGFEKADLEAILLHGANMGASDINILSNMPVLAKIYGRMVPITSRNLSITESSLAVNMLYGENGMAILSSGKPVDPSYEICPSRGVRHRFRVNATARRGGVMITIRTIPSDPPLISTMNLPQEILDNIMPSSGMVLIVGTTGSGKSTLLSSIIRNFIENGSNKKILTVESPIEFVYDNIKSPDGSVFISQEEVGIHIGSFREGGENALRQTPDIYLQGEARDAESIEALLSICRTGHLSMSTVHAGGVAQTARRIITAFPREERDVMAVDVLENMRMVIFQRLANSLDGKRIALREWLVFTEEIREELLGLQPEAVPAAIRRMLRDREQTIAHAAKRAYDAGLIDKHTWFYSGGIDGSDGGVKGEVNG